MCSGPLSTTDANSSLFLVISQVFVYLAIMFKFDDKLCAECGGFTMFSTIKNEGL